METIVIERHTAISLVFTIFTTTAAMLAPGYSEADGLFEEALESETTTAGPGNYNLELNGYARAVLFLGKMPEQDSTDYKSGYGELALALKSKFGDTGKGFAELRTRYGYDGAETGAAVDLREAYVDLYLGPLDLRLGHQIIIWGRADGINPTNNLTPRDMSFRSPAEDDTRSANLALRATLALGPTRSELVWVPFFSPSRYPRFKLPGPVVFGEPKYPGKRFEDGTFATKVNLELPEVEASVSYLFGYSPLPGLELGSLENLIVDPRVEVSFRAYQHHVVGIDFSTTISNIFGLRGEAALKWPKEYDANYFAPFPEVQYVLGSDKEWSDLYIIVQYIGKTVIDFDMPEETGMMAMAQGKSIPPDKLAAILADPEAAAQKEIRRKLLALSGQTEGIQHSLMIRVQYSALHETLSIELSGMYNFSTNEYLVRPEMSYKVADGMDAVLGAEVYGGPDETLFGMIDEIMSAGYLELKASF